MPKPWDYKHAYNTSEPTKINESNEAKKRWCLVRTVAGRAVEGLWNPSCLSVEDTKRRKKWKKQTRKWLHNHIMYLWGLTLGGLKIGHLCGTLKSSLSLKCNLIFYGGTRIAESSANTSKIQEFHACPFQRFMPWHVQRRLIAIAPPSSLATNHFEWYLHSVRWSAGRSSAVRKCSELRFLRRWKDAIPLELTRRDRQNN